MASTGPSDIVWSNGQTTLDLAANTQGVESSVLVSSGAFAATMSARCVEKKARFPIAEVWTRSPRT